MSCAIGRISLSRELLRQNRKVFTRMAEVGRSVEQKENLLCLYRHKAGKIILLVQPGLENATNTPGGSAICVKVKHCKPNRAYRQLEIRGLMASEDNLESTKQSRDGISKKGNKSDPLALGTRGSCCKKDGICLK